MPQLPDYRGVSQSNSLLQTRGAGRVLNEGQGVGPDLREVCTFVRLPNVAFVLSRAKELCLRSERYAGEAIPRCGADAALRRIRAPDHRR